jgi:hypothetical protein
MPMASGPGLDDPFDPGDIDDVRDRIVMPVVTSLIAPVELHRVEVGWGPILEGPAGAAWSARLAGGPHGLSNDLWVLVEASGRTLEWQIWVPGTGTPADTLGQVAFSYALRVEQWTEECLGRGPRQVAEYVIPARAPGAGPPG